MTKEELKEELKFVEEKGKEIFEKCGGVNPTLLIIGRTERKENGKDKALMICSLPEKEMGDRQGFMFRFGKYLYSQIQDNKLPEKIRKVDAVAFSSEGWMSVLSKEVSKKIDSGEMEMPKPSLDPKRKEILMFSIMDENGQNEGISYEIVRDEKKKGTLKEMPARISFQNKSARTENYLLKSFWAGFLPAIKMW